MRCCECSPLREPLALCGRGGSGGGDEMKSGEAITVMMRQSTFAGSTMNTARATIAHITNVISLKESLLVSRHLKWSAITRSAKAKILADDLARLLDTVSQAALVPKP